MPKPSCNAGLTVTDFNGTGYNGPIHMSGGATVSLLGCTFSNNNITADEGNEQLPTPERFIPVIGVIDVSIYDIEDSPPAQRQDTIVRLQDVAFIDNDMNEIVIAQSSYKEFEGLIYSDEERRVSLKEFVEAEHYLNETTLPFEAAPADRQGITATTPWFQSTQEVCFFPAMSACFAFQAPSEGGRSWHSTHVGRLHATLCIYKSKKCRSFVSLGATAWDVVPLLLAILDTIVFLVVTHVM
jgi:hypothetical protein